MQGKMAIIGDGDSILAFRAVGVDVFSVKDPEAAEETLKKLAKEYKIIFITEDVAVKIDATIKKYLAEPYPIVVSVPGNAGSSGYGMECVKRAMDKALGVDIFIDDKN